MSRLVHVGQVIVDIVMYVPHLPERGGDVLASSGGTEVGGGFNVLAAAVRQGLTAAYGGMHGTGPLGDLARKRLAQEQIDVLQPKVSTMDTGFTVALVDAEGERTFATTFGAEGRLRANDLARIRLFPDDIVYVSGYGLALPVNGPAVSSWLSTVESGVMVVVDPGPLAAEIPEAVLKPVLDRADWISCNEREAGLLTGEDDPLKAAEALRRRNAIVRVGAGGCVLATADEVITVPGFPVEVVDTNGAGDAHTGAFMAALAAGLPPAKAARRANAAAAIAVTRRGPASAPTIEEVHKLLSDEEPGDVAD
ncbi:PfkB family carbohydrate kinase [Kutzneria kofuensis]|uniref:Sugar/nucleoside kinase (Ribokinase family) n=1 Tax=Kutzneria kofuensis TaxID=103725 RepID=A0A7W9KNY4_9PSEU|nr:PfkB family carbohydrate kinase [Kutzneria kofuensis]MBB5895309.1 sugar/nucleoside kinase (ribokinase family) [Kutzneria kofuensis]